MSKAPESTVIVPLYQYPVTDCTWQPLHQAISKHPHLQFVIIINPNSGPGVDSAGWLPDKNYFREIPKLSERANVTVIGYVRLDYCKRPMEEVLTDLKKYSNWSRKSSETAENTHTHDSIIVEGGTNLSIQGIFFDEAPNIWRERHAKYLDTVHTTVKTSDGFSGKRLTILNCGTVPDPDYALHWSGKLPIRIDSSSLKNLSASLVENFRRLLVPDALKNEKAMIAAPDIVVVFEESSELWYDYKWQTRLGHLLRQKREKCCFMVHSVPCDKIEALTTSLRHRGQYLFVTGLQEKYYESFGEWWNIFISAMAADIDGETEYSSSEMTK